jgi:excisionase family DNA binding protein
MTGQRLLTTRELAELLRIRERKVYDMAAAGEVPCTRVTGKLLFPLDAVEAWLAANHSGPEPDLPARPPVFLGSHDPLLDWAIRESGAELATRFEGSQPGLDALAAGEGIAAGVHLLQSDRQVWNVPFIERSLAGRPVVLVEFAWRRRGLIVPAGRASGDDAEPAPALLAGKSLALRQPGSGSQMLFESWLHAGGFDVADLDASSLTARSETDAAMMVLEGRAEIAFGLEAAARQMKLGFMPVLSERFDLAVDRKAWFDPPFQAVLKFLNSAALRERALAMGGYDISGLGTVHYNAL